MDINIDTPVQFIPRVGPSKAGLLEKLGIITVQDLIRYPPFRYNDYSQISDISDIAPGRTVTVQGTIKYCKNLLTKNGKRIQLASLSDDTGSLDVVFFNQPYLARILYPSLRVRFAGQVNWFGRKLSLVSPDYEIINEDGGNPLHTGRLVPVYSETVGITSKWLRARIAYAIEILSGKIRDDLPDEIRSSHNLIPLEAALKWMHFPDSAADARQAIRRMAFDELFLIQLRSLMERMLWEKSGKSYRVSIHPEKMAEFTGSLPFQLTADQQRSVSDIFGDFVKPYPMNRLLEGDVGSGKTVVAAIAAYAVHQAGLQTIIMAPTEILATQHYASLKKFLEPHGINVGLITGSHKITPGNSARQNDLFGGRNNRFDVITGTHALLSRSVSFDKVGLIVIDEQQRFGVAQRKLLRDKAEGKLLPHLLTMTATPIPRTVAMTLYGHLSLSTITQMPHGRIPVKTWVVPDQKRQPAYDWMKEILKRQKAQAFVVCPLIADSESLSTVKSAVTEFEHLKSDVFCDFSLALLHGRMKPAQKTGILEGFKSRKYDILVSTPVVEVGIDVPDAVIMLVEAADRFGLGQLHQLRGRVGRSDKESYCLLFTESDSPEVIRRLKALETNHSGPDLAETDLKLRGPGELFGTKQHGIPDLKYANFMDTGLMLETRESVRRFMSDHADLNDFPLLSRKLQEGTIQHTGFD